MISLQPTNLHPPLQFYIGDDWFIELSCFDTDGAPLDLFGAQSILWRLSIDNLAETPVHTLTVGDGITVEPAVGSAVANKILIRLTAAKTLLIPVGFYRDYTVVTTALGIVTTQSVGRIEALLR